MKTAQHTVILAALIVALAAIVAIAPLAGGQDYPNHLARVYILGSFDHEAALQKHYEIAHQLTPDQTMDLVAPFLADLIGVYPAGAVMIFLAMAVAPFAAYLLGRRLNGNSGRWLPLLAFGAVFNAPLAMGFLNYLIASGLAILGFRLWIERSRSLCGRAILAAFALFISYCHALSFLLFGYLVLLWQIAPVFQMPASQRFGGLVRSLFPICVVFLPGAALIVAAIAVAPDIATQVAPQTRFGQRPVAFFSGFAFHQTILSAGVTIAAMVAFCGALYVGLRDRVVEFAPRMAFVCAGLVLLMAFMPTQLFGVWGLHLRFGFVLIMLTAASLRFRHDKPHRTAGILFSAVIALQFVNGAAQSIRLDAAFSEARGLLSGLEDGARVLTSASRGAYEPHVNHASAFVVIEANGFAPQLFTNTSVIEVASPYRGMHLPQAPPLTLEVLVDSASLPPAQSHAGEWSKDYFHGWPARFTHVLHAQGPGRMGLDLECLSPVGEGREFALYRIIETESGGCGPAGTPSGEKTRPGARPTG